MSPARPNKAAMTPKQFRELIDASGLTQQQVADRLGVSRNTVVRWLMGKVPISRAFANLIRLSFAN